MDILLLALRILLAALLYAFLGVVVWILWRDLRVNVSQRTVAQAPGRLVVVTAAADEPSYGEPELANAATRSFPLQPVTSIGRSAANTVAIDDTFASSHHALLTWRDGHWWIEDRGSRNGTLVNGELVEKPTLIAPGDVIRVGETRLRLELAGGAEGQGT